MGDANRSTLEGLTPCPGSLEHRASSVPALDPGRGVFIHIFDVLAGDIDLHSVMVDGTFAKVHQHGTGALRGNVQPAQSARQQGIGRSKGGLTTKLMAVVDKKGRLVRFTVRPGNVNEGRELPDLLGSLSIGELIADKAYDSNRIRLMLAAQNIIVTIPSTANRDVPVWYETESYEGGT